MQSDSSTAGWHAYFPGPLARRLIPSPIDVIVIAAYLISLGIPLVTESLWWRLKTGEWIISNFNVPRQNLFSFSAPTFRWIDHEWLSDALLYGILARLGPGWLLFVRGALLSLVLWILFRLLRRRGGVVPSLTLTVCVALGLLYQLELGPLLVAVLFLLLVLLLVEDATWRYGRTLVLIPLLFLFWANMHGTFLIGMAVLALHGLGGYLDARRGKRDDSHFTHLVAAVLAIPLTLCNPYYGALYRLGFEDFWQLIASGPLRLKLLPLPFLMVAGVAVFGTWLIVALAGREVRWRLVLPLIFLTPIALLVPAYATFWVVLAAVTNMEHIEQVASRVRHDRHSYLERVGGMSTLLRRVADRFANLSKWDRYLVHGNYTALTLALALAYFSLPPGDAYHLFGMTVKGVSLEELIPEDLVPNNAVATLLEAAEPGARVMTPVRWGGYLVWAGFPTLVPFMEGRESSYPLDIVEDYDSFETRRPGWEEILERHEVDYLLWPSTDFQTRALLATGLWVRLYEDPLSTVLARRQPLLRSETTNMMVVSPSLEAAPEEVGVDLTPKPQKGTPEPLFGLFRPNRSGPNRR